MTVATLSPAEFDVGLLSALNLSLPQNQAKLRRILDKAKAKQQVLAQLQQVLAQKTTLAFGKVADAAACHAPLGLQAPPGLCLPDDTAPPPGLVPRTGLAGPDHSQAGERGRKGVPGIEAYSDSDAEATSIGDGYMTRSASEGTEPEPVNFEINPHAPCFVPSFLNTPPSKMPATHEATGMTLSPIRSLLIMLSMVGFAVLGGVRKNHFFIGHFNKQQ